MKNGNAIIEIVMIFPFNLTKKIKISRESFVGYRLIDPKVLLAILGREHYIKRLKSIQKLLRMQDNL